ncbi:DUF4304 domain-containing protein [Promicromonospora sp. NPDC052451]|uniref:DUF4304 domain-containing protein n=1 Tax=Promicromonospora sp. NPDC052451 TaxID=3364407 RepID=UPI0037C50F42
MDAKARARLGQEMKSLGYRKRGSSYFRISAGGLYAIISVQKSAWDSVEYLNFGYAEGASAESGWIPESRCQVRFRLDAVRGVDARLMALMSTEGLSASNSDSLVEELLDAISPFLEVDDWAGLRAVIDERISDSRLFVHRDVRRFLGLGLPE